MVSSPCRRFSRQNVALDRPVAGAPRRRRQLDVAMTRLDQTDQRFEKRGLAGTIGAEQQHGFAGADVEIDAPQHLHGAVAGIDAGGFPAMAALFQAACSPPRNTSMTCGTLTATASLPSKISLAGVHHDDAVGDVLDETHQMLNHDKSQFRFAPAP